MQFSLLNFLMGAPNLTALANGTATTGGDHQNPEAALFSELLVDANAAGGDLQQGQQQPQASGELADALVSNITIAQELGADTRDSVDVAMIKDLLAHKISPEEARDLLAQMDADSQSGEAPPEGLYELLESIENGGTDVSVQELVAQVPAPVTQDDAPETRSNTAVQRMLQWLQGALNPNAAPMEALAYANAAAMFPDAQAAKIDTAERTEEKERTEEIAVLIPNWVRQIGQEPVKKTEQPAIIPAALPRVELPTIQMATAAAVEETPVISESTLDEAPVVSEAPVDKELILVATKHNSAMHASDMTPDAFDAFIADLDNSMPHIAEVQTVEAVPAKVDGAVAVNTTTTTQTANDTRVADAVRIHHANIAYAHTEVMDQVQVGVRHAMRDGVDRITIQLNPHELGRVEVKMDIVADGMSQVSFLVDKQETFDLLQRDARSLERMLQDAGVKADAGSMQFNLRQDSQSKEPWGEANGKTTADGEVENSTLTNSTGELSTQMYVHLVSDRIDIRA